MKLIFSILAAGFFLFTNLVPAQSQTASSSEADKSSTSPSGSGASSSESGLTPITVSGSESPSATPSPSPESPTPSPTATPQEEPESPKAPPLPLVRQPTPIPKPTAEKTIPTNTKPGPVRSYTPAAPKVTPIPSPGVISTSSSSSLEATRAIKRITIIPAGTEPSGEQLLPLAANLKTKFLAKILIVGHSSTQFLPEFLSKENKIKFHDFSLKVQDSLPLRSDEIRIYLFAEKIQSELGDNELWTFDIKNGNGGISLSGFDFSDSKTATVRLEKLVKKVAAKLLRISGDCGILAPTIDIKTLDALPKDYCPQDQAELVKLRLLK
jgi:hypothetical protein